ncbi:MAG: phosphotransferase [Thiotrichales bacterium]|nr:phosphotransferase [Thiotrichales bacterium]
MTWLPAEPAFLGLRPPELEWKPYFLDDHSLAYLSPTWQILTALFDEIPTVHRLDTHHPQPYGFYRFQGAITSQQTEQVDWFVKLVEPSQTERLMAAQSVADYVSRHGVVSPPLIDGFPLVLADDVTAFAYPFWQGRLTNYDEADLKQLGRAVGKLHQTLAGYPQRDSVQQAGEKRHQMLVTRWQSLQQHAEQMTSLPEEAQAILSSHNPGWLWHLTEQAQMVHGDLNVGNILFLETGDVAFLDFEDSLTAWFDPLKDLAFIIERFVLTVHEEEQLKLHTHALLDAYFEAYPSTAVSQQRFVDLIQALAIRAMLLLAELTLKRQSVTNSEWKKFVFLYNLAERHRTELENITQPYTTRT